MEQKKNTKNESFLQKSNKDQILNSTSDKPILISDENLIVDQNKNSSEQLIFSSETKAIKSNLDGEIFLFPEFLPPQVYEFEERNAKSMASRIRQFPVETSNSDTPILSSVVVSNAPKSKTPILLIHGFDSSCLEWRRLFPLLENAGFEVYAVDILGWGFSKYDIETDFSANNKTEHLFKFWKKYINKEVIIIGASLGGTITIDFTYKYPFAVSKIVLIDAQGFVEGTGPLKSLPPFFANLGIKILKSKWLRTYANELTYFNKSLVTIDSMNVGRSHTFMPDWDKAMLSFMLSGGYSVSSYLSQIEKETLIIWGEDDKILEKSQAHRFEDELKSSKLFWIKDCGHLPHVEKPNDVFKLIAKFYDGEI